MIQNNVDHITRDRNIGFKILSEPERSISTAPINLLHLVDFGLRQLVNNTKKLGYSKINLLSYIILSLQHLHSTVCKKYDTNFIDMCSIFSFFHEGICQATGRKGGLLFQYQEKFGILSLKTK